MFVRRKIVPLIFKDSFYSRLEIQKKALQNLSEMPIPVFATAIR